MNGANLQEVLTTGCRCNCGGSCLLKVHIENGTIVRIETDDGSEPQMRACLRCRAYRQRVYAPDRVLYPLRRTGKRGDGKFERVSWDEALRTVAGECKRVRDKYGPAAVMYIGSGGDLGYLHGMDMTYRALCMSGGCTRFWGNMSREGNVFAALATYGTDGTYGVGDIGHGRDDLMNSKLVILWAMNPADSIDGTGTGWAMVKAHEAGTKFVVVDPRFTDTAAILADHYIPILPGSDTAVMLAMAYVIVKENLIDRKFIDTYTVGFDRFRDYILGKEDGIPKTPAWAERISGTPAGTLAELAREYATTKPAALLCSCGPGRSAMGEQYHRAAYVLTAITGNVGIPGGSAGAEPLKLTSPGLVQFGRGMMPATNPVDANAPFRSDALSTSEGVMGTSLRNTARVHNSLLWDAIIKGKSGGYASDYKMVYVSNSNHLNQAPNVNKAVQALTSLEFVAVQDQFITPTARFADIILPVNTLLERNDVTIGSGPHISFMRKAIESRGESRSHLEIGIALAKELGVQGYNDKSEEEWLKDITKLPGNEYESFKKAGVRKIHQSPPFVAFRRQIEDPKNNPFSTPSGKIEICSEQLAKINDPMIPSIPKYIETWEGRADPLIQKYPLQLLTTHPRRRSHSQFDNIPLLRELIPQAVMINENDAQVRGIANGDLVKVFNDRGAIIILAWVTQRIMPGVVDVPQGAWYSPDANGMDRAGCANVLTRDKPSPGGAFPANTALVQIEKFPG